MDASFANFVEGLHPSFERLMSMSPVTATTVPSTAPDRCIYLFSEGERFLYAGRTRKLRQRIGNHSRLSSAHNQAVFAFRLARIETGKTTAAYSGDGRRVSLLEDALFADAFARANERVRRMDLRYVEESDPLRQALLEIYVSVVLKTPFNDFDTH